MRTVDLFDNYLSGKLSADEIIDFENQLRSDPTFANAFNQHKILIVYCTTYLMSPNDHDKELNTVRCIRA